MTLDWSRCQKNTTLNRFVYHEVVEMLQYDSILSRRATATQMSFDIIIIIDINPAIKAA